MAAGLIAATAGVSALGAVAQFYQSEKARQASQKRLDEISEMFNAIKPPDYNVQVTDPPEYITQTVPDAKVDYSKLTPKQFELVGKYVPEMVPFIAEKNPEIVTKTEAAKMGRDAQMEALRELKRRGASNEIDPELQAKFDQAAEQSQRQAQSRSESILQDANRRGQMGSGLMFASQLQASSDAMQRAAESDRDAAVAAYRAKLDALRGASDIGSQVSGQEFQEGSRNADIINSFNQRTSRAQQEYLNQQAASRNDAQRMNLDAAQRIANQNTSLSNEYDKYNRNAYNDAQTDIYNRALAERSFQNAMMDKVYNNKLTQQDRQNKLKSQQYSDQMAKAERSAGMASDLNKFDYQAAQDRNQAIQGGVNAAVAGIEAYGQSSAQRRSDAAADDRAFYEKNGRYMTANEMGERNKRYESY